MTVKSSASMILAILNNGSNIDNLGDESTIDYYNIIDEMDNKSKEKSNYDGGGGERLVRARSYDYDARPADPSTSSSSSKDGKVNYDTSSVGSADTLRVYRFRNSIGHTNQHRLLSAVSTTDLTVHSECHSNSCDSSSKTSLLSASHSISTIQMSADGQLPSTSSSVNGGESDRSPSSRSLSLPPAPRKPPRNYHYTDITQMITPASMPTTSTSRSTRQPPIRIAQPPTTPSYYNSYNTMPQIAQRNPTAVEDSRSNYTTVFHANPANGSTTLASPGSNGNPPPMYRRQPLQQQPSFGSNSLSNIGSSGCTFFPANGAAADATLCKGAQTPHLPYFNSVPALGMQKHSKFLPTMHSAQSSVSSGSVLRYQLRGPSTSTDAQKMSDGNLFDLACTQQRQIDVNRGELEDRQKLIAASISSVPNHNSNGNGNSVAHQVQTLRSQIVCDESELAQLSAVQREARRQAAHNHQQRQELQQLEAVYAQDDAQLRQAVGRVDKLRKQLDLLYQRRAVAASAAIAQQRKVNAQLKQGGDQGRIPQQYNTRAPYDQMPSPPKPNNAQPSNHTRPQASVGPFQFNYGSTSIPDSENFKKALPPNYKYISKEIPIQCCYDESQRFLARGKPDQVSLRADSLSAIKRRSWAQASDDGLHGGSNENIWRYLIEEQKKGRTHVSFTDIMAARNAATHPTVPEEKNLQQHNEVSTSTSYKQRLKPVNDVSPLKIGDVQIQIATEKSSANHCENRVSKLDDLQKSIADKKEESNISARSGSEDYDMRNDSGSDDTSNTTTIEPDEENENSPTIDDRYCNNHSDEKSTARNDNITIVHELTVEKNVEITNKEDDEDETTVIAKAQNDVSNAHSNECAEIEELIFESNDRENYANSNNADKNYFTNEADAEEDDDGFMEDPPEFQMAGIDDDCNSTSDDASSSSVSGDREPMFDENSICLTSKSQNGFAMPKGILRAPIVTHHKRRVIFDQTILFLDVAYGGEYDMLVELASKIPDISVANGEGITALHNAICAGNQDIVNFLIENHADVNALDLDGWSPLHCAASCNNTIMLRLLVENGACVFATTLSKAETASDLFEETEEPFESGANYIQHVENCMGTINDAKVYAAFSYDAENDDELSFEEGDELRVIDRYDQLLASNGSDGASDVDSDDVNDDTDSFDDSNACEGESLWWLCERTANGTRGLVPRNYVALYPKWRFRERYGFRADTRLTLPSEFAGVRTVAQRRRRHRRRFLTQQQQDEQLLLLQWNNLTSAAAAASTSSLDNTDGESALRSSQEANSVIVNNEDEGGDRKDADNKTGQDKTKL